MPLYDTIAHERASPVLFVLGGDEVVRDVGDGLDEHQVPGALAVVAEVGVVAWRVAVLIPRAHVHAELHQRL